jgi:hypothetical protein
MDQLIDFSSEAQIESLASLLAGLDLELNFGAFAQVVEINFGREARAMEKNFVATVVGGYETEALVLDHLLDCAEHF